MKRCTWFSAIAAAAALGCGLDPIPASEGTTSAAGDGSTGDGATGSSDSTSGGEADDTIRVSHAFGEVSMPAHSDDASRCVSWTLDNEQALYVNNVVLANEGSFHHSNWFVVPDDKYDGKDGYWTCDDRGFDEFAAAGAGTVLFAQSTQSYLDEQPLTEGAVIKVPAHSRIVADIHTLNIAPRDATSGLWLTLEVIHPREVKAVVTAMTLAYQDLAIPPLTESRFVADCDLAAPYSSTTGKDLALRVHYVLPHYHYLGNYFDVTVVGGELDGESIFRLEGFNADSNGKTFDPPLELPGATGVRLTCGYDNWRDDTIKWGNGDGEMCVMLGLIEAGAMLGAAVASGNHLDSVQDGIKEYTGGCFGIALPKSAGQTMPTPQEIAGPLYLPPTKPGDEDIPEVPKCNDADPATAHDGPATLTSLRDTVFAPSCSFSSCHGEGGTAGDLDLTADDLHGALLHHTSPADPGMPLVTPGEPDKSWLYQLLSQCDPHTQGGASVAHMPLNAPILLDDALVAKVRAWIERGAPND